MATLSDDRALGECVALLEAKLEERSPRPKVAALAPVPALPKQKPAPRTVPTSLYRHYDADGVLLYVGITKSPADRFHAHATGSEWARYAARHTGEWFQSRDEALAAETAAIESEAPLFNKSHNDHPERQSRIDAYVRQRARAS